MESLIGYVAVVLLALVVFGGFIFVAVALWQLFINIRQGSFGCKWHEQEPEIFKTGCERRFYNADDSSHVTDWLTYCPYCSGRVHVVINQSQQAKGE
jgi:hypothetical protein